MFYQLLPFLDIFKKLLYTNLFIVRRDIVGKIFNLAIWTFCTLIVMGYLMQGMGLAADFGNIQLAGAVGTAGLFEVYGNTAKNIMDFEGERSIEYYLTLPTKASVVLLSTACAYACIGTLLSFAILPLGKIVLYNKFSLAAISWPKFVVITIVGNMFFGIFTLAVTAQVKSMSKMGNIWMRFIFPLWYFGGFQFSWAAMYKLSAPFAYILLFNPVLYIMEGMRAALLGQEGFIDWGLCVGMLCVFSVIFWFFSFYKMKRHLDFV